MARGIVPRPCAQWSAHVLHEPAVNSRAAMPVSRVATAAELTTATTGAHSHFGPRIWLAGRRLMSMRAATLRMPSATATVMISLRVLSSRSLHVRLAAMTSSPYVAGPVMTARYISWAGPTLSCSCRHQDRAADHEPQD